MPFKEKVIWITGASSGIGAELARCLAHKKAWLILTARNRQALEKLQAECLLHTTHCAILVADLSDPVTYTTTAAQALSINGHIDILINNAGVTQRSLAIDTPIAIDRSLMELNFFAPVALTKYLLPHFKERGSGHVVAISSMAGLMGFPMRTAYAASKHALMGFFETLQVEHTLSNFYITIVSPGRINTPISLSAVTADGSAHNKMDKGQLKGIPVQTCAQKIIKAIVLKKRHVIIAREERILWWLRIAFPPLYYRIARKRGLAKEEM